MGKSSFYKILKSFAMKGNLVNMTVGVIIGGAFGKIVLGCGRYYHAASRFIGGRCELYGPEVGMKPAEVVDGKEIAAVTLNYGNFCK